MHFPKISVIVPVYNAENWLERCISSILAQTVSDFELIIVNDGSSDKSINICRKYESDPRIHIYDRPNKGVSSARNFGLEKAAGEWITFIDADDWIDHDAFECYLKLAKPEINLLFGGHKNHYADGKIEIKNLPSVIINNNNFERYFSEFDFQWRTSPWAKFFRKSSITKWKLKFDPKMKIGEDALFLYRFMICEGQFQLLPVTCYNYNFEVPTSLTKKRYTYTDEVYFFQNIKNVITELQDNYQLKSSISSNKINWIIGYYTGRILNSLYQEPLLSRKKRIEIIKHLDLNQLIFNFYTRGFKERLMHILLSNKMFSCYDLLRTLKKFIYK